MKHFQLYILVFLFALFASVPDLRAQGSVSETENKIQSIFIYNFSKYIQWPAEYNTGDFLIGVLGETDLHVELQKMAKSKSVNGRRIVVKKYSSLNELDKKCHILFLSTSSSNQLSAALQKTGSTPTLIITQKDGLAKFGSLINFVSSEGKPRFELNASALEKRNLKYVQQLKTIAIVI